MTVGTFTQQRRVLAARYAHCLAADAPTLLLLLVQPPFIGWLCTVVWGSVERDTESLYFVMALSCVWFGCIGACREIVRERAIIERERFFGVSTYAVVASRFQVLAVLGAAQALMLQVAVEWKMALHGLFPVQTAALVLATWCGTGLGLVVSAVASSQERAVAVVPLLLLPQVLFSEFAVPRQYFNDAVKVVELFMPVRWAYRAFVDAAAVEPAYGQVALSLLAMVVYAVVLAVLACVALLPSREI